MSSNRSNDPQYVEHGVPLAEAFNLPTPLPPERQIDKFLAKLTEELAALDAAAAQSGAKQTAKAAQKYRQQMEALRKKVQPNKPDGDLVRDVVTLLQAVRAERATPVREAGVNKAIATFEGHAGPSAKQQAAGFHKQRERIADEDDPRRRCDEYYELERVIIKADLQYREAAEPGSTWQTRMEFAVEDAEPHDLAKEGFWKGAKIGFFTPLPGATLLGGAIGALAGAIEQSLEKPPVSADEWRQLGESFVAGQRKKIDDMAFSVPEASVGAFTKEARRRIDGVHERQFAPDQLPETRRDLGKSLMAANTAALQQLLELKRDYPPDATPQAFVQQGKLVVAKPAPKVESLVLQGGGGKGVGYPAVLEEMNNAGMLDKVDLLVGTSIGALNAACLAAGGLKDERALLDLEVFEHAFDVPGFKKQYPGVKFGDGIFPSCAGQMAKLDALTSRSIGDNLADRSEQQVTDELVEKLRDVDDETLARLGLAGADDETIQKRVQALAKKVKNQNFEASDRTSQMITFGDLALLHQLDPKRFKELTITGWEGTGDQGKSVYFTAKDPAYVDMPVALAARISMGLPIIAPVYWNGRGPFYDGGLGSNAPVEATPGLDKYYGEHGTIGVEEMLTGGEPPVELQQAMQKTMLMTFDEGGKANQFEHGQGRHTVAPDLAEKLAVLKKGQFGDAINPEFAEALRDDAQKAYNGGVNTLQVFHGNQTTTSLGPLSRSAEELEYAENMARMKGLEQLDQRADQAAAVTCGSADEALGTFSTGDMQKFVAAGVAPQAGALIRELYEKCRTYLALDAASRAARSSGDVTELFRQLASSPWWGERQQDLQSLRGAYDGATTAAVPPPREQLAALVEQAGAAFRKLPSFLQSLVKPSVLVPLQKKLRAAPKEVL